MPRRPPASRDLERLRAGAEGSFIAAIRSVARAAGDGRIGAIREAQAELAAAIRRTWMAADLLGRRRFRLDLAARARARGLRSASPLQSVLDAAQGGNVPNVPFLAAIESLLEREPILAAGWRAAGFAYTEDRAFAVARATSLNVVKRTRDTIALGMLEGLPISELRDEVKLLDGWDTAYADTVIRTNIASAHSAGRFQEASAEDVRGFIVGLRFSAIRDGDVRHNHLAANGLTAAVDDPVWDSLAPPLGYQCRCVVIPVDRVTAKNRLVDGRLPPARIPPGARADRGFSHAGRPDRTFYG